MLRREAGHEVNNRGRRDADYAVPARSRGTVADAADAATGQAAEAARFYLRAVSLLRYGDAGQDGRHDRDHAA